MLEEIQICATLIALIIRNNPIKEGLTFFTKPEMEQQVAKMKYPAGSYIIPHFHNKIRRELNTTSEVIIIRQGTLRIDFYDKEEYCKSCVINSGDIVLLFGGSHGFKILEDLEMIEIKQGPYVGDLDKTKFKRIDDSKIIIH